MCCNNTNSSPNRLGNNLVAEIIAAMSAGELDRWIELLTTIKLIDGKVSPTEADQKALSSYADTSASTESKFDWSPQSLRDWSNLTKKCHGSYVNTLKSGYMLPILVGTKCLKTDDFWIEYIYVLNFDNKTFDLSGKYIGIPQSYPLSDLKIGMFR
jgi:hypothetical protein